MRATTTVPATSNERAERVMAATTVVAQTGAALTNARADLQKVRAAGDWDAAYQEMTALHAVALAEADDRLARMELEAAREAEVAEQLARFRREDSDSIRELAPLLLKAAEVEQRRVEHRLRFEAQTGRQVAGELGSWPELHDATGDDGSRLERWLAWAAIERGYSPK